MFQVLLFGVKAVIQMRSKIILLQSLIFNKKIRCQFVNKAKYINNFFFLGGGLGAVLALFVEHKALYEGNFGPALNIDFLLLVSCMEELLQEKPPW